MRNVRLQYLTLNTLWEQIQAVRRSVTKGQPYGSASWVVQMVVQWNLGITLRERGRPKKELVVGNGS